MQKLPFVVTKVEKRNSAGSARRAVHHQHAAAGGRQEAGLLGSQRTMRAAQDLYEGIEIGEEGPVGLITYMRTDSVRVSDTAIDGGAGLHREATTRKPYLPETPNSLHLARPRGCRTPTRRSGPTDVRRRPEDRCRSTSSRTSSGSTS